MCTLLHASVNSAARSKPRHSTLNNGGERWFRLHSQYVLLGIFVDFCAVALLHTSWRLHLVGFPLAADFVADRPTGFGHERVRPRICWWVGAPVFSHSFSTAARQDNGVSAENLIFWEISHLVWDCAAVFVVHSAQSPLSRCLSLCWRGHMISSKTDHERWHVAWLAVCYSFSIDAWISKSISIVFGLPFQQLFLRLLLGKLFNK
jgi:hypothetical protein